MGGLIASSDLAEFRALAAGTHRDTCRLLDPPSGRGASGAPAAGDYVPAGDPLPCRIGPPARTGPAAAAGGLGTRADYEVAFAWGTAVSERQRIEVVGAGEVLEVVGVADLGTFAVEVVASCADVD